jgi:hypothetical protein
MRSGRYPRPCPQIPSGLENTYAQIVRQVNDLDDVGHCKRVLLTAVNTYCPLYLSEFVTLARLPELAVHYKIVRRCGLLTIREDDDMVYFVYQSTKDYLTKDPESDILSEIFPFGHAEGHCIIVSRSVEAMSKTLQRDNYILQYPSCFIGEAKSLDPDPLASIRYTCIYWIDHLCKIESRHDSIILYDNSTIDVFLKKYFLYWLEALSLMRSISSTVTAIKKLEILLAVYIHSLLI